ncbi:hypothetical protein BY996DRAFT_6413992 [Phakopsora pachyrhizi]|nr:hypothetical protein BY996DRAFT_6413992 [Phakopsora pachyrhizi]
MASKAVEKNTPEGSSGKYDDVKIAKIHIKEWLYDNRWALPCRPSTKFIYRSIETSPKFLILSTSENPCESPVDCSILSGIRETPGRQTPFAIDTGREHQLFNIFFLFTPLAVLSNLLVHLDTALVHRDLRTRLLNLGCIALVKSNLCFGYRGLKNLAIDLRSIPGHYEPLVLLSEPNEIISYSVSKRTVHKNTSVTLSGIDLDPKTTRWSAAQELLVANSLVTTIRSLLKENSLNNIFGHIFLTSTASTFAIN